MKLLGDLIRRIALSASSEYRLSLLSALAKSLEIEAVVKSGKNGLIEGHLAYAGLFTHYVLDGSWSLDIVNVFRNFYHERGTGTYIDIGSNIGMTLIPMTSIEGLDCIGIEASPSHFDLLRRNLLRNRVHDRVALHNAAIFEKPASITFELSPNNFGDNRVRTSGPTASGAYGEESRETISVDGVRIDDLLADSKIKRPLAIKMDIQGSEPYLFLGGPALLGVTDLLVTEFWPYGLARLGFDADEFLHLLAKSFRQGVILDTRHRDLTELLGMSELIAKVQGLRSGLKTGALELALLK
jgi:FkbM family methyltransferase